MNFHDAFVEGASQNVAFAAAGGASAASTAFGSQTRYLRLCFVGVVSATAGARYVVGDGTPTAAATSTLLPPNWVQYVACNPGQKVAVISNDATTGSLSIVEMAS